MTPATAAATAEIRQEIHVGRVSWEQGQAVAHQGGCSGSRNQGKHSWASPAIAGGEQEAAEGG